MKKRIYLSPPHMNGTELDFIKKAFACNYIAPIGPQIDAFECEFAKKVGAKYAVALSSGTASLHLALRYAGVSSGDEVICSTLTFVATANPILYLGAKPVFVDSDHITWNMDPTLLNKLLSKMAGKNKLPRAVIVAHLYGQSADIDPIKNSCEKYGVALIEDAAESLGASYKGKTPGTFGKAGIYSFNGNKILTTSGGGMLVTDDATFVEKVRFWATQARDDAPHYEHSEMGYNYRMSNILAAIGRGQLQVLDERVKKKREIYSYYKKHLQDLPGLQIIPEADFSVSSRWLTCITISPEAKPDRNLIIDKLKKKNIESRPIWKPMHLQPLFSECDIIGGKVSEELFRNGLCLPSGTQLIESQLEKIVKLIRSCW